MVRSGNIKCKWFCCAARSAFAGRSGAQRSEEIANGEGVASGSATIYEILLENNISKIISSHTDRWSSGLRHWSRKPAYGFAVPRVRIPLCPPVY